MRYVAALLCVSILGACENDADRHEQTSWDRVGLESSIAKRRSVLIYATTNMTIGAKVDNSLALSNASSKVLAKNNTRLATVDARNFTDFSPGFVDKYIGREVPSVTLIRGGETIFRLCGKFDSKDVEQLIYSAFGSEKASATD